MKENEKKEETFFEMENKIRNNKGKKRKKHGSKLKHKTKMKKT